MKKILKIVLCLSVVITLMLSLCSCNETKTTVSTDTSTNGQETNGKSTTIVQSTDPTLNGATDNTAINVNKTTRLAFSYNGKSVLLPCTVNEFLSLGFKIDDQGEPITKEYLENNCLIAVQTAEQGSLTDSSYLYDVSLVIDEQDGINESDTNNYDKLLVVGLSTSNTNISLNGIQVGVSSYEDVINLYGDEKGEYHKTFAEELIAQPSQNNTVFLGYNKDIDIEDQRNGFACYTVSFILSNDAPVSSAEPDFAKTSTDSVNAVSVQCFVTNPFVSNEQGTPVEVVESPDAEIIQPNQ